MDETLLSDYSDKVKGVISDIWTRDDGFHSQIMVSDVPFYEMLESDSNGVLYTEDNVIASMESGGMEFTAELKKSTEMKCWFFKVKFGSDEFDGVVRFNTLYNAKGPFSFAFLNDTELSDFDDVTQALPYSSFLAMVK